eukprot:COSAG05_NODE_48_length_24425_cov_90.438543_32_plen_168_part_00
MGEENKSRHRYAFLRAEEPPLRKSVEQLPTAKAPNSPSKKGRSSSTGRASVASSSSSSSSSSSLSSSKRPKLGLYAFRCGHDQDQTTDDDASTSPSEAPDRPVPSRVDTVPIDAERMLGQRLLRAPEISLQVPAQALRPDEPPVVLVPYLLLFYLISYTLFYHTNLQ